MNQALKDDSSCLQHRVTGSAARMVFLDYLRIFAFVSVLVGHKFYGYVIALSSDQTAKYSPRLLAKLFLPLLQGGGAGVVVFFLVSGYIITHVLQTEQTCEFVIKRVFRIYPLYIVALLSQFIILALTGPTPSLSTLALQLLLVGDLFGTAYALNGVEWTLRVEVAFYVFMATLSGLNLIHHPRKILPFIFIAMTLVCGFIAPIPSANIWSKGYFTIYSPFLLLGSMFYLLEKKQLSITIVFFFVGLVFYQYYSLISMYQQKWIGTHFAILAFIVFLVSWFFRQYLTAAPWVLLISEMTYAVYLFHNWFFDFTKSGLANINVYVLNPDLQALIVLLPVCFIMVRCVEKPGIRLGRILLTKLRGAQSLT